MNYNKLHPDFKLNGTSFSTDELLLFAQQWFKVKEGFKPAVGSFLIDWLSESGTITVKTSGSTGKPKSIVLLKQQMVNSAMATGTYFNLKPKSTALLCLPTDYIAGKMMLVRAMVLGLWIDVVSPTSNPLTNIDGYYDFSAMVPLQLQNSISKIEQIKILIVGGAPMSAVLKSKIQDVATKVYETYGMTETITHVAVKKANELAGNQQNFKILPGVSIAKDKRDCLVITAPKISNHPVITNDIVDLINETEFKWLGRLDNVINSGGVKLFPEQIEVKLAKIISLPFFVAGVNDDILGQKLILIIEGNATSALELNFENTDLERFEVPKAVFWQNQFVQTANGKINRAETLKLLSS